MRSLLMLAVVASIANLAIAELLIGDFKTLQHDVSGKIYAKDEKTLVIYNFKYDGNGPDAFFWIGKSGTPKNTDEATTYILGEDGNYAYRDTSAPLLGAYNGKDITLTLPEGWKMSDIKWISVWCRKFSVNFGELVVPEGFKAPEAGEPGSPAAEPEPETGYPEPEPLDPVDDNSVDGYAEPEPSTKAEPEPEPASATTPAILTSLVLGLLAATLL
jgi:hypothetical protein